MFGLLRPHLACAACGDHFGDESSAVDDRIYTTPFDRQKTCFLTAVAKIKHHAQTQATTLQPCRYARQPTNHVGLQLDRSAQESI